jgi:hypothetical protein
MTQALYAHINNKRKKKNKNLHSYQKRKKESKTIFDCQHTSTKNSSGILNRENETKQNHKKTGSTKAHEKKIQGITE